MSAVHTPGPWRTVPSYITIESPSVEVVAGDDYFIVASPRWSDDPTHTHCTNDAAVMQANAHLIASAPDLLRAARIAVTALAHICESSPHDEAFYGDAYRALDEAISKATGSALMPRDGLQQAIKFGGEAHGLLPASQECDQASNQRAKLGIADFGVAVLQDNVQHGQAQISVHDRIIDVAGGMQS